MVDSVRTLTLGQLAGRQLAEWVDLAFAIIVVCAPLVRRQIPALLTLEPGREAS
jgi:hypothetical protein